MSDAALYNNISKIVSSFEAMNDPRVRAQAEQFRMNRELFPLRRQEMISGIGLTDAKTKTEGFQQGFLGSGTRLNDAKTHRENIQNTALSDLYNNAPLPSGGFIAPTTNYSYGAAVGGPDEMQDDWTNRGYSATGKNLTPGIVAVNPKTHPLGTVFRDENTGEVFIAGDKHGNSDPNVIDFFQEPDSYQKSKTNRALRIIGREGRVGRSPEEVRIQLGKYRQQNPIQNPGAAVLPPMDPARAATLASISGIDPERHISGLSRAEALRGGISEERGRELALAQGVLPTLATAITPGFQQGVIQQGQQADYAKAMDLEAAKGQTELHKADMAGRYGLADTVIENATKGLSPGASDGSRSRGAFSVGDQLKLDEASSNAAYQRFGIPLMEEGGGYDLAAADPMGQFIKTWSDSVNRMLRAGYSMAEAQIRADIHHFGTTDPVGEGKLEPGKRVNAFNQQVIPEPEPRYGRRAFPGVSDTMELIQGIMNNVSGFPAPRREASIAQGPPPMLARPPERDAPQSGAEAQQVALPGRAFPSPAARINDRQREKDRNFNIQTLKNLGATLQASGADFNDVLATLFSRDPSGLRAGLYGVAQDRVGRMSSGSVGPGGAPYDAAGVALKDLPEVQHLINALSDDEALRYMQIDPEWVRRYRQGTASSNPAVEQLLQKY